MTRKRRKILFWISAVIFLLTIAPVVLYSFGYRIAQDPWNIVRAGGLAISSVPATGTRIYVDTVLERETTLLFRKLFLQGLTPRLYHVRVEKDGYFPWEKRLRVYPERVTDVQALLIKDSQQSGKVLLQGDYISIAQADRIHNILSFKDSKSRERFYSPDETKFISRLEDNATTTERFSNAATTLIQERALMQYYYDSAGERIVWWDDHRVWIKWLEGEESLPLYTDTEEALLLDIPETIRNATAYPYQDAIIVAYSNAIMTVELDGRDHRNIYPLYKGNKPSFVLSGDRQTIYILDEGNLISMPLSP